ncbi:recombinase family protein [Mesorhizobium sp. AR02]|uniref:recombinase family protein n=1 Tax=Mesorhizobium sp. AR02 TaxID=2865837 RepID=UPI002962042B|nr:recombinase family protein [Mesorhizobium sp. AR02]
MEFNALDAQREACEAYVASQRAEGWVPVPDRYDDGGISGGTLERPALKRLLKDIEFGLVDVVVVYKIDRLSRSLTDFSKLVEIFEANDVTFVSITQSFNTTTSMGRLTLNILLSFAQFEREAIGERIRDKFAASRRKGMWMGGNVPLGYRVESRKLIIQEDEAATVRMIFDRFPSVGSATTLARTLNAEGVTSRGGRPIDKGYLYKLLSNRVYIGEAVHKGTSYPGEHQAIISLDLWNKVRSIIAEDPRKRAGHCRRQTPALLRGLIFAPNGYAMTPAHTRKKGRLYRYYVTTSVQKLGPETCSVKRLPAAEIEAVVIDQVRKMLRQPEIIVKTWAAARVEDDAVTEGEVRDRLVEFDVLWDELFPTEQARIIQLLVERIEVDVDGISIRLRTEGMTSLVAEMRAQATLGRAA